MKKIFSILCFILLTGAFVQAQTVNVTFQADMNIEINKGYFNPTTDTLTCPGDFDNWLNEPPANTTKIMTDDNSDGIYTFTIAMSPNATYGYKFNIGMGWDGKDEFQGMDNRSLELGASDTTLNPTFFNNYTPYSGVTASVTFNVDMHGPAKSTFDPSADHVFIAGNFTDWQNSAIEMTDPEGDSVYSVTVDTLTSGDLVIYKFVHSPTDAPSGTWESPSEGDDIFGNDNNRIAGIVDTGNVITRFWNNADPNVTTGNGNIFFDVDMSVANELGVFDPDIDSVQIRGSFNGWNDSQPEKSLMNQNPADPNDWYLNVPFTNEVLNSEHHYKFFVKSDTSGGRTPYANTGWEVSLDPTDAGNRDRPVTFEGSDTQEQPLQYFEGVKPDWVIPAGTTVECNFSVDMTYATLADTQGTSPVFQPGVDTVYWLPQHPFYYAVNGLPWPAQGWVPARVLEMTDPDQDMIYTGTLTINGPNFNGFLYTYGYTRAGELIQESGSQLDMRVRYIAQSGPRAFGSTYDMPLDIWSNSAKPEEDGPATSVRELPNAPLVYSLGQNYPNPFNPTTKIRFSVADPGLVTLKVYNLLGQEVATLLNNEIKSGSYEVDFDATNYSSGVYFYTITANSYTATKKMILLK
jgi:hypothetical protein